MKQLRRSENLVVLILLLVLGPAGFASAHGPTIDVSHSQLSPPLLNLFVGTTVHFNNLVAMPGGHVIVDESGAIKSPPLLAPGDGWHYTFDEEGTFELHIKQHPGAKARIVIVPKP
ncbi:MAG: hypothetical protein VCB25_01305 [Myxococcota bacterium]